MLRDIKKDYTKRQLLKMAIELFSKNGFEKTTIEDITKKAKVAKGTFYNFFEKKEDVLLCFLDSEIEKSRDEIQKKLYTENDFFDQLELISTTFSNHIYRNKRFVRILIQERFMNMGTKNNPNESRLIHSLSQLIDLAKQRKEIKDQVETKRLVELIFAINTTYAIYWLNGTIKSKKEFINTTRESLQLVFDGIKTRENVMADVKH